MTRTHHRLLSLLGAGLLLAGLAGFGPPGCGSRSDKDGDGGGGTTGPCAQLDETACINRADCGPIYIVSVCGCEACPTDGECPPCGCAGEEGVEYDGCEDVDPCEELTEGECIASPGCEPEYVPVACPGCAGPDCPPCDDSGYDTCSTADKLLDPASCGDATCGDGEFCCNESCGICAPEGGSCIEIACN